jgi:protein gp37
MGRETGIAWTDHTFNPWWGCVKISPACTNCYAATFDKRLGGSNWGPGSTRKFFGDKHWNEPRRWNKDAERDGVRRRVFCASMADVFEDRPDLVDHRLRLWHLIEETPALDWLLLTKRPENIRRMLPSYNTAALSDRLPFFRNVWLGTTVENQDYAEERIDHLLANPAVVHFLSCEPLLGPIDLSRWIAPQTKVLDSLDGTLEVEFTPSINWIITGSESGRNARPQNVDWYRALRDQCYAARVAFFFKQADPTFETDEQTAVPELNADGVQIGVSFVREVGVDAGPGSWCKGDGIIEQPYLDGAQHLDFPIPRDLDGPL